MPTNIGGGGVSGGGTPDFDKYPEDSRREPKKDKDLKRAVEGGPSSAETKESVEAEEKEVKGLEETSSVRTSRAASLGLEEFNGSVTSRAPTKMKRLVTPKPIPKGTLTKAATLSKAERTAEKLFKKKGGLEPLNALKEKCIKHREKWNKLLAEVNKGLSIDEQTSIKQQALTLQREYNKLQSEFLSLGSFYRSTVTSSTITDSHVREQCKILGKEITQVFAGVYDQELEDVVLEEGIDSLMASTLEKVDETSFKDFCENHTGLNYFLKGAEEFFDDKGKCSKAIISANTQMSNIEENIQAKRDKTIKRYNQHLPADIDHLSHEQFIKRFERSISAASVSTLKKQQMQADLAMLKEMVQVQKEQKAILSKLENRIMAPLTKDLESVQNKLSEIETEISKLRTTTERTDLNAKEKDKAKSKAIELYKKFTVLSVDAQQQLTKLQYQGYSDEFVELMQQKYSFEDQVNTLPAEQLLEQILSKLRINVSETEQVKAGIELSRRFASTLEESRRDVKSGSAERTNAAILNMRDALSNVREQTDNARQNVAKNVFEKSKDPDVQILCLKEMSPSEWPYTKYLSILSKRNLEEYSKLSEEDKKDWLQFVFEYNGITNKTEIDEVVNWIISSDLDPKVIDWVGNQLEMRNDLLDYILDANGSSIEKFPGLKDEDLDDLPEDEIRSILLSTDDWTDALTRMDKLGVSPAIAQTYCLYYQFSAKEKLEPVLRDAEEVDHATFADATKHLEGTYPEIAAFQRVYETEVEATKQFDKFLSEVVLAPKSTIKHLFRMEKTPAEKLDSLHGKLKKHEEKLAKIREKLKNDPTYATEGRKAAAKECEQLLSLRNEMKKILDLKDFEHLSDDVRKLISEQLFAEKNKEIGADFERIFGQAAELAQLEMQQAYDLEKGLKTSAEIRTSCERAKQFNKDKEFGSAAWELVNARDKLQEITTRNNVQQIEFAKNVLIKFSPAKPSIARAESDRKYATNVEDAERRVIEKGTVKPTFSPLSAEERRIAAFCVAKLPLEEQRKLYRKNYYDLHPEVKKLLLPALFPDLLPSLETTDFYKRMEEFRKKYDVPQKEMDLIREKIAMCGTYDEARIEILDVLLPLSIEEIREKPLEFLLGSKESFESLRNEIILQNFLERCELFNLESEHIKAIRNDIIDAGTPEEARRKIVSYLTKNNVADLKKANQIANTVLPGLFFIGLIQGALAPTVYREQLGETPRTQNFYKECIRLGLKESSKSIKDYIVNKASTYDDAKKYLMKGVSVKQAEKMLGSKYDFFYLKKELSEEVNLTRENFVRQIEASAAHLPRGTDSDFALVRANHDLVYQPAKDEFEKLSKDVETEFENVAQGGEEIFHGRRTAFDLDSREDIRYKEIAKKTPEEFALKFKENPREYAAKVANLYNRLFNKALAHDNEAKVRGNLAKVAALDNKIKQLPLEYQKLLQEFLDPTIQNIYRERYEPAAQLLFHVEEAGTIQKQIRANITKKPEEQLLLYAKQAAIMENIRVYREKVRADIKYSPEGEDQVFSDRYRMNRIALRVASDAATEQAVSFVKEHSQLNERESEMFKDVMTLSREELERTYSQEMIDYEKSSKRSAADKKEFFDDLKIGIKAVGSAFKKIAVRAMAIPSETRPEAAARASKESILFLLKLQVKNPWLYEQVKKADREFAEIEKYFVSHPALWRDLLLDPKFDRGLISSGGKFGNVYKDFINQYGPIAEKNNDIPVLEHIKLLAIKGTINGKEVYQLGSTKLIIDDPETVQFIGKLGPSVFSGIEIAPLKPKTIVPGATPADIANINEHQRMNQKDQIKQFFFNQIKNIKVDNINNNETSILMWLKGVIESQNPEVWNEIVRDCGTYYEQFSKEVIQYDAAGNPAINITPSIQHFISYHCLMGLLNPSDPTYLKNVPYFEAVINEARTNNIAYSPVLVKMNKEVEAVYDKFNISGLFKLQDFAKNKINSSEDIEKFIKAYTRYEELYGNISISHHNSDLTNFAIEKMNVFIRNQLENMKKEIIQKQERLDYSEYTVETSKNIQKMRDNWFIFSNSSPAPTEEAISAERVKLLKKARNEYEDLCEYANDPRPHLTKFVIEKIKELEDFIIETYPVDIQELIYGDPKYKLLEKSPLTLDRFDNLLRIADRISSFGAVGETVAAIKKALGPITEKRPVIDYFQILDAIDENLKTITPEESEQVRKLLEDAIAYMEERNASFGGNLTSIINDFKSRLSKMRVPTASVSDADLKRSSAETVVGGKPSGVVEAETKATMAAPEVGLTFPPYGKEDDDLAAKIGLVFSEDPMLAMRDFDKYLGGKTTNYLNLDRAFNLAVKRWNSYPDSRAHRTEAVSALRDVKEKVQAKLDEIKADREDTQKQIEATQKKIAELQKQVKTNPSVDLQLQAEKKTLSALENQILSLEASRTPLETLQSNLASYAFTKDFKLVRVDMIELTSFTVDVITSTSEKVERLSLLWDNLIEMAEIPETHLAPIREKATRNIQSAINTIGMSKMDEKAQKALVGKLEALQAKVQQASAPKTEAASRRKGVRFAEGDALENRFTTSTKGYRYIQDLLVPIFNQEKDKDYEQTLKQVMEYVVGWVNPEEISKLISDLSRARDMIAEANPSNPVINQFNDRIKELEKEQKTLADEGEIEIGLAPAEKRVVTPQESPEYVIFNKIPQLLHDVSNETQIKQLQNLITTLQKVWDKLSKDPSKAEIREAIKNSINLVPQHRDIEPPGYQAMLGELTKLRKQMGVLRRTLPPLDAVIGGRTGGATAAGTTPSASTTRVGAPTISSHTDIGFDSPIELPTMSKAYYAIQDVLNPLFEKQELELAPKHIEYSKIVEGIKENIDQIKPEEIPEVIRLLTQARDELKKHSPSSVFTEMDRFITELQSDIKTAASAPSAPTTAPEASSTVAPTPAAATTETPSAARESTAVAEGTAAGEATATTKFEMNEETFKRYSELMEEILKGDLSNQDELVAIEIAYVKEARYQRLEKLSPESARLSFQFAWLFVNNLGVSRGKENDKILTQLMTEALGPRQEDAMNSPLFLLYGYFAAHLDLAVEKPFTTEPSISKYAVTKLYERREDLKKLVKDKPEYQEELNWFMQTAQMYLLNRLYDINTNPLFAASPLGSPEKMGIIEAYRRNPEKLKDFILYATPKDYLKVARLFLNSLALAEINKDPEMLSQVNKLFKDIENINYTEIPLEEILELFSKFKVPESRAFLRDDKYLLPLFLKLNNLSAEEMQFLKDEMGKPSLEEVQGLRNKMDKAGKLTSEEEVLRQELETKEKRTPKEEEELNKLKEKLSSKEMEFLRDKIRNPQKIRKEYIDDFFKFLKSEEILSGYNPDNLQENAIMKIKGALGLKSKAQIAAEEKEKKAKEEAGKAAPKPADVKAAAAGEVTAPSKSIAQAPVLIDIDYPGKSTKIDIKRDATYEELYNKIIEALKEFDPSIEVGSVVLLDSQKQMITLANIQEVLNEENIGNILVQKASASFRRGVPTTTAAATPTAVSTPAPTPTPTPVSTPSPVVTTETSTPTPTTPTPAATAPTAEKSAEAKVAAEGAPSKAPKPASTPFVSIFDVAPETIGTKYDTDDKTLSEQTPVQLAVLVKNLCNNMDNVEDPKSWEDVSRCLDWFAKKWDPKKSNTKDVTEIGSVLTGALVQIGQTKNDIFKIRKSLDSNPALKKQIDEAIDNVSKKISNQLTRVGSFRDKTAPKPIATAAPKPTATATSVKPTVTSAERALHDTARVREALHKEINSSLDGIKKLIAVRNSTKGDVIDINTDLLTRLVKVKDQIDKVGIADSRYQVMQSKFEECVLDFNFIDKESNQLVKEMLQGSFKKFNKVSTKNQLILLSKIEDLLTREGRKGIGNEIFGRLMQVQYGAQRLSDYKRSLEEQGKTVSSKTPTSKSREPKPITGKLAKTLGLEETPDRSADQLKAILGGNSLEKFISEGKLNSLRTEEEFSLIDQALRKLPEEEQQKLREPFERSYLDFIYGSFSKEIESYDPNEESVRYAAYTRFWNIKDKVSIETEALKPRGSRILIELLENLITRFHPTSVLDTKDFKLLSTLNIKQLENVESYIKCKNHLGNINTRLGERDDQIKQLNEYYQRMVNSKFPPFQLMSAIRSEAADLGVILASKMSVYEMVEKAAFKGYLVGTKGTKENPELSRVKIKATLGYNPEAFGGKTLEELVESWNKNFDEEGNLLNESILEEMFTGFDLPLASSSRESDLDEGCLTAIEDRYLILESDGNFIINDVMEGRYDPKEFDNFSLEQLLKHANSSPKYKKLVTHKEVDKPPSPGFKEVRDRESGEVIGFMRDDEAKKEAEKGILLAKEGETKEAGTRSKSTGSASKPAEATPSMTDTDRKGKAATGEMPPPPQLREQWVL